MDSATSGTGNVPASSSQLPRLILAWLVVGLPLLWGLFQTLKKAAALFR
jgi:hypothetical protein